MNLMPWPPEHSIRTSQRAKRVIVQITPSKGLEIILPQRSQNQNIELILNKHKSWIEKNQSFLNKINLKRQVEIQTPSVIHFQSVAKTFEIKYCPRNQEGIKIKACPCHAQRYEVSGAIHNKPLVFKALQKWVHQKAILYLIPWLKQLSLETGLNFSNGAVRNQSTLWGSCSASQKISLNTKLLFLPIPLVRYVILHELCHTVHLNHSKRFWQLVSQFDANYAYHKNQLKKAASFLPPWIE